MYRYVLQAFLFGKPSKGSCREEIILAAQNHNSWENFHRLRDETNLIWGGNHFTNGATSFREAGEPQGGCTAGKC